VSGCLVYAPLSNFSLDCSRFEVAPNVQIVHSETLPDLSHLELELSGHDRLELQSVSHWVEVRWEDSLGPSPSECINLVLLALWMAGPMRTRVVVRFELERNGGASSRVRHHLDQFNWADRDARRRFDTTDLRPVPNFFSLLSRVRARDNRMVHAAILTHAGCMAHRWDVALVCDAAAAEAALTYSKGRGLTERLAQAYACLVATDGEEQALAHQEFRALYSARSDVMHGRGYDIPQAERTPMVARFEEVLRRIWRSIADSTRAEHALESTDAGRERFFSHLRGGWSPPGPSHRSSEP